MLLRPALCLVLGVMTLLSTSAAFAATERHHAVATPSQGGPPGAVSIRAATGVAATRCGHVLVIGVRGSGQTVADHGGWGREMAVLREGIVARAKGLVVDERPLHYPSEAVQTMVPTQVQIAGMISPGPERAVAIAHWAQTRLGKYMRSIDTGVSRLRAAVADAVSECGSRKVVLTGYSQGAMVVHRAVVAMARHDQHGLLRRVAAVGLLADGDRTARSRQHNVGSAADVAKGVAVLGLVSRADIPRAVADRTFSYCTDNDIVCDATPWNLAVKSARGVKIHTGYDARDLALLAGHIVRRLPKPPPLGAETGRVGFVHPTWGPSTFITSFREYSQAHSSEGFMRVVDAGGRTRWFSRTGSDIAWYQMELNDPAVDTTGQVFVNWNPGRYNGVTVLQPAAGGFIDHGTLVENGNYRGRFYYAEVVDQEADGVFEIVQHHNDCDPSCAGGTITSETWRWNGTDYALPG